MTLRDDTFGDDHRRWMTAEPMTAERMTPKVMTVPDDTLRLTKKAHGNPKAFYFILNPKGNYILLMNTLEVSQ